MSKIENSVSINPYFNISDENMETAKEILKIFCHQVSQEAGCLYYNFAFNGNVLTCREAYADAAAVMAHLENCGEALAKFSEVAKLFKIEVLGPVDELEKLKEPLTGMNPDYYELYCGIGK